MHPDVLRDQSPDRGILSSDQAPAQRHSEALRRLLEHTEPYPHCPQCGRAMLAESVVQFTCPNRHVTITLPGHSRWDGLWQKIRMALGRPREHSESPS